MREALPRPKLPDSKGNDEAPSPEQRPVRGGSGVTQSRFEVLSHSRRLGEPDRSAVQVRFRRPRLLQRYQSSHDLYLAMQTAQKHDVPQARVSPRKPTAIASGSNPAQTPAEVVVPVAVPAQDEAWIEPPPVTQ